MKILSRGLMAAACASALLTSSAEAATVTVRVEGEQTTLVRQATVTTAPGTVNKDGDPEHTCDARNAIGAFEQATAGDWSGPYFDGLGYAPETIKGETHNFSSPNEYYAFFFNKKFASQGLCDTVVQDGDEIVLFPACYGDGCTNPRPLDVTFPAVAQAREPFTVGVDRLADDGSRTPAAGATVTVAGRSYTTGEDGRVTVTVDTASDAEIIAEAANSIRDTGNAVCVHDGNDGRCGFPKADGTAGTPAPATTSGGTTAAGAAPDRTAPRSAILGIREGQTFSRANAPRVLRGVVGELAGFQPRAAALKPDPSGVLMVKVRLTRNDRGRCSSYSIRRERFVRTRCGASRGFYAKVSDRAEWEYQLASRLPRGRYVLDVVAIDKAYNRDDERRRGENRLVFRVR